MGSIGASTILSKDTSLIQNEFIPWCKGVALESKWRISCDSFIAPATSPQLVWDGAPTRQVSTASSSKYVESRSNRADGGESKPCLQIFRVTDIEAARRIINGIAPVRITQVTCAILIELRNIY